jgi:hypothetical protein
MAVEHLTETGTQPPRGHRNVTIAGVAGALAIGLLGGALLGRATARQPDPVAVPGLASASTVAMLTARVDAINDADAARIASFYSADAVLEEFDPSPPVVTRTATAIGEHLASYAALGFRIGQTGTATQLPPYVAEPLLWTGNSGGIVVYQLDAAGKIAHQWVPGGPVD